jgi:hypothetical protein
MLVVDEVIELDFVMENKESNLNSSPFLTSAL